jgi:PPOX class probable F420-dependent enzyme
MEHEPTNPRMGHRVNQRALVKMTDDEVEDFLHGRRTMTMCTLGPDGSVHAVAMWYGFLEGAVALESKVKAQKVRNLVRDPRITCLVEDGLKYEELRGVSLVGTAEIIDDPERMWEAGVSVFERYQAPFSEDLRPFVETMLHNRVVIKVHPERVVSWDHRKLGLRPT